MRSQESHLGAPDQAHMEWDADDTHLGAVPD
jgi:hypothetical protein